ncbi:hypothetical protein PsorP6_014773 [Peronosclerospora sorghi]|uniref:Uncharacterized protein n=1 Tax=Peronosclerospora sorghi TaxID=230839 RepID=A0ACC0VS88_9STRA|nr:hypothetical protein PsorP6_014773 [Peronosclerospora sorghi]
MFKRKTRTSSASIRPASERRPDGLNTVEAPPSGVSTKQKIRCLVTAETRDTFEGRKLLDFPTLSSFLDLPIVQTLQAKVTEFATDIMDAVAELNYHQHLLYKGVKADDYFKRLKIAEDVNPFKPEKRILSWAKYVRLRHNEESNKIIFAVLSRYEWEKPLPVMIVEAMEDEQLKPLVVELQEEQFRVWREKKVTQTELNQMLPNVDHSMVDQISEAYKKFSQAKDEGAGPSVKGKASALKQKTD